MSEAELLVEYPELTHEDILAAIAYGAEMSRERILSVPITDVEKLQGASDDDIFAVCCNESRVLVTLDHDFGQVLRYPPERSAGIVILEPGSQLTPNTARSIDRVFDGSE